MTIDFKDYKHFDLNDLRNIWNTIIADGLAFPTEELFTIEKFEKMLISQSSSMGMTVNNQLAGMYILHPNAEGRCSHIANCSFAIKEEFRGKKLAFYLVKQATNQAKEFGFKGMQFNAVNINNRAAIKTYEKLGFQIIGCVPKGFKQKDNTYVDMYIMFLEF